MTEFFNNLQRLQKVADDIVEEMTRGLAGDKSSLLMIPTYVYRLPDPSSTGDYLALDFGGSTFRVVSVSLRSGEAPITKSTTLMMENDMKTVSGEILFDHLANCIGNFITSEKLENKDIALGFTFSFPISQHSLSEGVLVRWTKGFQNEGVVGQDVGKLLSDALSKNSVTSRVRMMAMANDTAGTQVSGALAHANCHGGFIIGTGSNACYTERVENVTALKNCNEENVIINLELGNFGELGHLDDILTKHDRHLDEQSSNPGKQLYEKMISGLYMGEMVRLAVVDRRDKFTGVFPDQLLTPDLLDGADVSDFISDGNNVKAKLGGVSDADVQLIQNVCHSVSNRAARLTAAGVHAMWLKRNKQDFVVAVDGSVYLKHATFAEVMKDALRELGTGVSLVTASDGSGLGSALIASTS